VPVPEWLSYRVKAKNWEGQPFRYAEIKEDGVRIAVIKRDGVLSAWGRKNINMLGPVLKYLKNVDGIPDNCMIDGELLGDRYIAFDLTVLNGKRIYYLSHEEQRSLLREYCTLPTVVSVKEKTEEHMNRLVKKYNAEGLMLKQSTFGPWFKFKPTKTMDAIVTDFKYGEGRHAHRLGALEVSVWKDKALVPIASVGGGFTDEQRDAITPKDVGRVLEVRYDCFLKNRLRFPRFIRWRDDKPSEECEFSD